VKNEEELKSLIDKAKTQDIQVSVFREPDINNEITAIAIEPTIDSVKLTSTLNLMR